MTNLTFVIPVGAYHRDIAERAIASVKAQTVPCALVVIHDAQGKGAGWARNRGLEQVTTPYVSFLDADDVVMPQFAEACLGVIEPSKYVYTDWDVDGQTREAPSPCDVWTKKTYHIVTTVMHTDDVLRIGGYDELLPGAEDSDFGVRLRLSGVCGIRLPFPLFAWGDQGTRSRSLRASGKEATVQAYMAERYGGYSLMGCCGDNHPTNTEPGNVPEPGDVLAQAIYQGNRRERGLASGRLYPNTGNGKLLYMDARDIEVAPHMWRRVTETKQVNGVVLKPQYQPSQDWQSVAQQIYGGGQASAPATSPVEYKPVVNSRTRSDVLNAVKGAK